MPENEGVLPKDQNILPPRSSDRELLDHFVSFIDRMRAHGSIVTAVDLDLDRKTLKFMLSSRADGLANPRK